MADIGTQEGIWTGVGQGMATLGQAIAKRREGQVAARDKHAEAFEKQMQDIAANIAAIGADTPEARPLKDELQRVVTMHNSLYGMHETPLLMQRVQNFTSKLSGGKIVHPYRGQPQVDIRAQITPEQMIAGAPRPSPQQDLQQRFQQLVQLQTKMGVPLPDAQKNALEQIMPKTATAPKDYEERLALQNIIDNPQSTPQMIATAKASLGAMERWTAIGAPIQVTAANQAQLTTTGQPAPAIGSWVQPQVNPQGQTRYMAAPPDVAATTQYAMQMDGDSVASIRDSSGREWRPDVNGKWDAAPPEVRQAVASREAVAKRQSQAAEDEKARTQRDIEARQRRTQQINNQKTVTTEQIKQAQDELKPHQKRLDQLNTLADQAPIQVTAANQAQLTTTGQPAPAIGSWVQPFGVNPQGQTRYMAAPSDVAWTTFLAALRDSDFGKGKTSTIDQLLGKSGYFGTSIGATQNTEITTQQQFEQILGLLYGEIQSEQGLVDSLKNQIAQGQRHLSRIGAPSAQPNPAPPKPPPAATQPKATQPSPNRGRPLVHADGTTGKTTTPTPEELAKELEKLVQ